MHSALLAAALFQQLEDHEAARGAHRLGDLADGQRADHGVEGRRQLTGLAPADVAAFEGVLAAGIGNGGLGEVGALVKLIQYLLHLVLSGLDVFRRGAASDRNEDIGEVKFFGELRLAQVGGQEVLHFLWGDLNPLRHPALTHAADDHLAANLVTGLVVRQTVMCQRGAELLGRHAVTLGDGGHGAVEFFVADAHTGALADLQLQVLDDQAFEHLLVEHIGRGLLGATLGDGLLDLAHAIVELALHDHIVIDDGHDPVEGLDGGMRRAP